MKNKNKRNLQSSNRSVSLLFIIRLLFLLQISNYFLSLAIQLTFLPNNLPFVLLSLASLLSSTISLASTCLALFNGDVDRVTVGGSVEVWGGLGAVKIGSENLFQ